ncbi:MAG: hypothetical protein IPK55_12485 [Streptococcus sp.]|nr:hypothetical protein [Streptococcus sp.]
MDKEIEGISDCLICYCVVHYSDKSLPKLGCKNCKNKFHSACITKWFNESQKSNCPHVSKLFLVII